jgi:hypothetical protein
MKLAVKFQKKQERAEKMVKHDVLRRKKKSHKQEHFKGKAECCEGSDV